MIESINTSMPAYSDLSVRPDAIGTGKAKASLPPPPKEIVQALEKDLLGLGVGEAEAGLLASLGDSSVVGLVFRQQMKELQVAVREEARRREIAGLTEELKKPIAPGEVVTGAEAEYVLKLLEKKGLPMPREGGTTQFFDDSTGDGYAVFSDGTIVKQRAGTISQQFYDLSVNHLAELSNPAENPIAKELADLNKELSALLEMAREGKARVGLTA